MGIFDALGGSGRRSAGMSPVMMGLMGLLAYRTLKGKGRLADMLGTGTTEAGAGGALSGGALGGGLKDLLDRFRDSGQQNKAESWVAKGPNQPIAPDELENALGEERIQWLMEQTGMQKDKLLAGLSNELPNAIDELTPDGRLPTEAEINARQQPRRQQ
jgi:uncharacterized protein YidB (DUF937 family)